MTHQGKIYIRMIGLCAFLASFLATGSAHGAGTADLFQGKAIPVTIQFKEVTTGWKQLCVVTEDLTPLKGIIEEVLEKKLELPPSLFYTRGETLAFGKTTFLVAYRQANTSLDPVDIFQWMIDEAHERIGEDNEEGELTPWSATAYPSCYAPEPLTPETPLHLCLLNMSSVGSIEQIRSFNLEQEIASTNEGRIIRTRARSLYNLRQLVRQLQTYVTSHDNTYPSLRDARTVTEILGAPKDILSQPVTHAPYLPNPGLAGLQVADIPTPEDVPAFYESVPGPDGTRAVGFLDGRAKYISKDDWITLQTRWGLPEANHTKGE